MNYTLHQLEIYRKVAELQSVTRASEELYLTQPAISIQLKKLQEQFPQPLFEVIGSYISRILEKKSPSQLIKFFMR
jgi:DNA-binding transcriptional LysR family regulator